MEKDLQKKGYFNDPERFADLINGIVFSGRQILISTDLSDMDSQTGQFHASSDQGRRKLRGQYRDLIRKAAFGVNFIVLGIENQENVHYLMPLRCMSYDAEEYERQAVQIRKKVKQRKNISSAEFLSGFAKDSRLSPCLTLVIYYGNDWDGATELYDILDFTDIPQELKDKVNNYKVHICEVRNFNDTDVFRTDLKQVFDCIRYSEDPDKLYRLVASDSSYREMEEDTYDIIAQYTQTTELMQIKKPNQKEGKFDMCKAITELIDRGRMEGIASGIEQSLRDIVANMLRHDVPDETIRAYTECSQELIETVRREC